MLLMTFKKGVVVAALSVIASVVAAIHDVDFLVRFCRPTNAPANLAAASSL